MNKTYAIRGVDVIRTEEIDFRLYNDIFGKEKVDEICEEDHPTRYIIEKESCGLYQMSIEYLEAIIAELKAKGATYVEIVYLWVGMLIETFKLFKK